MAYDAVMISELSDTELDAVAAGTGGYSRNSNNNIRNVAVAQAASNNQLNLALFSRNAGQGGSQSNDQSVNVS